MIIRSTAGNTEYAMGLIRSAQNRMKVSSARMMTGQGGDQEMQRELRLAQAEQKLAVKMLQSQAEADDALFDILA